MDKVLPITNNILSRAFAENVTITPMKLQKIMYFLYREYLQTTNEPLFDERFKTWDYGPVLTSVYHYYKHYKDRSIKHFYEEDGYIYKVDEEQNPIFKRCLNKVWNQCKDYNGIELSKITHKPETAWSKSWDNERPILFDNDILNDKVEIVLWEKEKSHKTRKI